ncbi:hypothetical protein AB0M46_04395 [Dactylosporangium sp. NPDC051485]|uniref:hypothetical protein n=1 Tax=Dactylosporangium sp. NPDC051485 TaxID=3154846 RepID=UPI003441A70F
MIAGVTRPVGEGRQPGSVVHDARVGELLAVARQRGLRSHADAELLLELLGRHFPVGA